MSSILKDVKCKEFKGFFLVDQLEISNHPKYNF